ncbi:MAG: hypothetical protein ABEJ05_04700 [Haloglomus sp.]
MNLRSLLAAAGAATVVAGVVVLLEPSLSELVQLRPGGLVVTALAALAAVQGLVAVSSRLTGEQRAAVPDEVERRFPATVPGDEFDDLLADLPALRVKRRDEERAAVRERLEGLAVEVLVDRGLDEAAARRHLEEGTWTADERAASFFVPPGERELLFGARLRDALGADLAFTRRARHAIGAIRAHAEREAPLPATRSTERGESTGATGASATSSAATTTESARATAAGESAATDGGDDGG